MLVGVGPSAWLVDPEARVQHESVVAQQYEGRNMQGTVKWFNDAKGYGFISQNTGEDVFVHYSSIEMDGFRTLSKGEPVMFEVEKGPKGLHAVLVKKPMM